MQTQIICIQNSCLLVVQFSINLLRQDQNSCIELGQNNIHTFEHCELVIAVFLWCLSYFSCL